MGIIIPKIIEILKKDRSRKSPEDVNYIISSMKELKSLEYGRKLALNFAQESQAIFKNKLSFLKKEPYRQYSG